VGTAPASTSTPCNSPPMCRSTWMPGRPISSASRHISWAGRRASARSTSDAAPSCCRSCREARRSASVGRGPRTWPASSALGRPSASPMPIQPPRQIVSVRSVPACATACWAWTA
jgi:hypothetical protein